MRTETFLIPSGVEATIREATGADDDILSSVLEPDVMINRYLSRVTLKIGDNDKIGEKEIKDLLLRDKYFILIKSRIFSLGETLYFTHDWGNGLPPEEYAIDLNEFIWDYTKPFPTIGDENYSDQRMPPYSKEPLQKVLSSGKEVRMDYLDGHGESLLLKTPQASMSVNLQLVARNLQVHMEDRWATVKNFQMFSSKEMAEIRSIYKVLDKPMEGLMDLTHPLTGETIKISLLQIQDFFFPVKI